MAENINSRNVSVIKDADGNNIVMINDILFKGKQSINWEEVEIYLKRYVSEFYNIAEDDEIIYILELNCQMNMRDQFILKN